MVFETLNRLKWTGGLEGCEITIAHRGAPGNKRVISGREITELKKTYFCCMHGGRESLIPMHRILEVSIGGEKVWKRKS